MRCFSMALSALVVFSSCDLYRSESARRPGFGWVPQYLPSDSAFLIRPLPPREMLDAGSFALLGDLLFIVDREIGFHVFDNADPANPINLSFVSVPGCSGLTARDQFVYANNLTDLVTLDVSDPVRPELVDRVKNLYGALPDYPELNGFGAFECVDPNRGILVGWLSGDLDPDAAVCQLN